MNANERLPALLDAVGASSPNWCASIQVSMNCISVYEIICATVGSASFSSSLRGLTSDSSPTDVPTDVVDMTFSARPTKNPEAVASRSSGCFIRRTIAPLDAANACDANRNNVRSNNFHQSYFRMIQVDHSGTLSADCVKSNKESTPRRLRVAGHFFL